jgi:hypothetical protein
LIQSNIDFLNKQFDGYLQEDEVSHNGLLSYYIDYFAAQLANGGFSQFVYNSRWGQCVEYVKAGFVAIGAVNHLRAFENAAFALTNRLGEDGLQRFLTGEYFGENAERDLLNESDAEFLALEDTENLIDLNAQWLRSLPDLVAITPEEIAEEIQSRSQALPDRQQRAATALANEPRFVKLIRALCTATNQQLDRITAGDPAFQYQGQQMISWHFLTDQGHFQLADINGKAIMLKGNTDDVVCEIEAGEQYDTK